MTDAQNDLLKLIHETKAVSIWNHKTGPVFWYAASVPGPFYVNTELVIGPELAPRLLDQITNIIAETSEPKTRASKLTDIILSAYKSSDMYRRVIAAMITKAKTEFSTDSYDLISGGERRDWLFSIPVAHELGIDHVFLFKDHSTFCLRPLKASERALHIADLINNAASYFDLWFPILKKANLECIGTLCVNTRGSNGISRLAEYGLKTVTLNAVDTSFFKKSLASGLIEKDTLNEITDYFLSPQDWAKKYLMKYVSLFDVQGLDKKSFERLQSFFTKDPWKLQTEHADFFAKMQKEIDARLRA